MVEPSAVIPSTATGSRFRTMQPGRLPYEAALALQEGLLERRRQEEEDTLVLLEHPPVITFGRRADPAHLLLTAAELLMRGISRAQVGRGGDVTYHGPGQLIGYPIVDLEPLGRDLHRYLRLLEATLVDALAAFAITAETIAGKTGVWVKGEKVASIGVGVRRWVAWHGFALNVGTDLSGFSAIVPCGLPGVTMTSMERLLDRSVPMAEVEEQVIRSFARIFNSQHAGDHEASYQEKTRLA